MVAEGVIAVVVDLEMQCNRCFPCGKSMMVQLQPLKLIGPTSYVPHARRKNRQQCLCAFPLFTNRHGPNTWTIALPTTHSVLGVSTVLRDEDENLVTIRAEETKMSVRLR